MKIALVISSLGTGGAERILTRLASHWADSGHDVTLMTLASQTTLYALNERVRRVSLLVDGASPSTLDAILNSVKRVRAIRRALASISPDVVLSFADTTNVLTLLATRGLRARVFVSERVDPSAYPLRTAWRVLRDMTYPLADALVVQTDRVGRYFTTVSKSAVRVIPNPIAMGAAAAGGGSGRQKKIIGVGRLVEQKGFDMLLPAFKQATADDESWTLEIWGEGSDRRRLDDLAVALGIRDRVRMPGVSRDVGQVFEGASIFALSSRFEGFPNVLCEAMAAGLPCVAFDCPSGPREIIENEIDGLLVDANDIDGLASSLRRLMRDQQLRQQLGSAARRSVSRFSTENVLPLWNRLIEETPLHRAS